MIKDRIKELRKVSASSLVPNPKNWRTHPIAQQEALNGVLREIGFAGAVLAREIEGGQLMLIDGHLLTFDPLSLLAETNAQGLDELLRKVNTGSMAVQDMLMGLATKAGLYLTQEKEVDEVQEDEKTPKVLCCPKCGKEVV